jgi:predicted nucleotidyltransferase component of viral defense system
MTPAPTGLSHSVQVRLLQRARAFDVDPNLVLARFAAERFLYRLSRSRYADRFVLKGALLLVAWLGETVRPTRDADLLGLGDLSDGALARIFAEICQVDVAPDGLVFEASSIEVAAIRPEDVYGGKRVKVRARLGPARLRVQIDVGIGDAVVPDPEWIEFPSLLDMPRPRLRAYRPETAVAEKVHTMVVLGIRNSRMRDFFDVYVLAERQSFDGHGLVLALRATFKRRRTPLPSDLPVALTPAFAAAEGKRAQWTAFVRKSGLTSVPADLDGIVSRLALLLEPVLQAASVGDEFPLFWPPSGPWTPAGSRRP